MGCTAFSIRHSGARLFACVQTNVLIICHLRRMFQALAQWLHDRDFKFGLYTSAGNVTCTHKPVKHLYAHMYTCVRSKDSTWPSCSVSPPNRAAEATTSSTHKHSQTGLSFATACMRTLNLHSHLSQKVLDGCRGVDYVKLDWCGDIVSPSA